MGLVFGLVVGFLAAQVWSDSNTAQAAVNREASALRAAVLLSGRYPDPAGARVRVLVRRHIERAVTQEWPAMAEQRATLTIVSPELGAALDIALALSPTNGGQTVAQRSSSRPSGCARRPPTADHRQRVERQLGQVDGRDPSGGAHLLAIAFVHCDNRLTAAITLGMFASAVAVSLVMIAAQARPFAGQLGVKRGSTGAGRARTRPLAAAPGCGLTVACAHPHAPRPVAPSTGTRRQHAIRQPADEPPPSRIGTRTLIVIAAVAAVAVGVALGVLRSGGSSPGY